MAKVNKFIFPKQLTHTFAMWNNVSDKSLRRQSVKLGSNYVRIINIVLDMCKEVIMCTSKSVYII